MRLSSSPNPAPRVSSISSFKDARGLYRDVDDGFCSFWRIAPEQVFGRSDDQLFDELHAEQNRDGEREAIAAGTPLARKELWSGPSGSRWFHVTRTPIWAADGTLLGIAGHALDLALAGLDAAPREVPRPSPVRVPGDTVDLEPVLELISDFAFSYRVDATGRSHIEWLAGGFERTTGYSRADLSEPFDWRQLVHPLDRARVAAVGDAVRHNHPARIEHRILTKDGRERTIRLHLRPVWDPALLRVTRVLGAGEDITAQADAERALRESEARFRTLAEALPQIVWTAAADGTVDYHNRRWTEFTGEPAGTGNAWDWERVLHPDDVAATSEAWSRALASGADFEIEHRFRRAGGDWRWMLSRALPLRDRAGSVEKWFGTATDIHDQRAAALALEESEERLRLAVEAAAVGIWDWDLAGDTMAWTPVARRLFGFGPDEPVRHADVLSRLHPADRPRVDALLADAQRTGTYATDYRIDVPGAGERWIAARGRVLFDAAGRPCRIVGTVLDITERQAAAEALRQSEGLLAESQRVAAIGSWEYDLGTGRLRWSDEVYRVLGIAPGSIEPTLERLADFAHPEDRERVAEAIGGTLSSASPQLLRFRVIGGDGRLRHVVRQWRAIDDSGGRRRIVGTLQDVTDNVHAEQERLELEARVQRARRAESLAVLAGGIAHDFNNLLCAVIGNTDLLLLDPALDADVRERLKDVQAAGLRGAELARQMLAYSGRGRFDVREVRLADIVREAAPALVAALPSNATLTYGIDEDGPTIEADRSQLRQLLANLVANAVEALDGAEGTITVGTGSTDLGPDDRAAYHEGEGLEPGRYAVLEVRDTGRGIPPEALARIFEPFFSTHATGRGIGLSAVLGIARGHGGAVAVTSREGEGTLFRIVFPVV